MPYSPMNKQQECAVHAHEQKMLQQVQGHKHLQSARQDKLCKRCKGNQHGKMLGCKNMICVYESNASMRPASSGKKGMEPGMKRKDHACQVWLHALRRGSLTSKPARAWRLPIQL
eukprot:1141018-Pelagomonas_calceolata.AAC.6